MKEGEVGQTVGMLTKDMGAVMLELVRLRERVEALEAALGPAPLAEVRANVARSLRLAESLRQRLVLSDPPLPGEVRGVAAELVRLLKGVEAALRLPPAPPGQ